MNQTKLQEIEKIPPFRIHSTLYRTAYVVSHPPFIKVRNIANLDTVIVEGPAKLCISVRGIKASDFIGDSPTVGALIRHTRRLTMSVCRALSRIEMEERGIASSLATLAVMRVYWAEETKSVICDVVDLSEDYGPDDPFLF